MSVANISKILWPKKEYKMRGETLRQMLSIADNNILSNRNFRNHFEHYDERIETYFENNAQGVYIDLAMNPSLRSESFSLPLNTHRGYNSYNNTLVFRGETFDLNEVFAALEILVNKCKPYALLANSMH